MTETKKENECDHCWHPIDQKHFPDWWAICCKCHEWKKVDDIFKDLQKEQRKGKN